MGTEVQNGYPQLLQIGYVCTTSVHARPPTYSSLNPAVLPSVVQLLSVSSMNNVGGHPAVIDQSGRVRRLWPTVYHGLARISHNCTTSVRHVHGATGF